MTALSDLLAEANVQGWSTREIARRAQKNGHKLSQPSASVYMGGRHGTPTEPVLAAFSDVLNIPIDKLRTAAGLPAGAGEPWSPPAEANRLDLRQRRALEELIRSMVASETLGEDQDDDEQNSASMDRDAQPDGVKPDPELSAAARERRDRWVKVRDSAHGLRPATAGGEDREDQPWEQDEYGLAAKRGRNRGREARDQQDREAEDGGA